ncbi:MAG TPA: histone [Candidatus Woesearchaeota archaeon]|nr:histone [Candidatus Woesearchaeota archaeon]
MVKKNIPLAAVEKIMKSAGASRVADKAKSVLRDALEEKAEEISQNAIKYAKHSKRKTVKGSDIKLAAKI